jgi:outer membrane lipoprotein SlyB
MNMNRILAIPVAAAMALAIGGLANANPPPRLDHPLLAQSGHAAHGIVDSVEFVREGSEQHSGATGAVVGGVVGGLLGHQIGSGSGNTAATIAGAVGGAVVGNQIEKRHNEGEARGYYRIRVRLDNGRTEIVNQADIGDLRSGDRVRVDNGRAYRY